MKGKNKMAISFESIQRRRTRKNNMVGFTPEAIARPSEDEQREMCAQAQNGDRAAADALVRMHLPLVKKIAQKYASARYSMESAVADGMIGTFEATQKADLVKLQEVQFISYAVHWIREYMRRGAKSGGVMHIPDNVHQALNKKLREAGNISEATLEMNTDDGADLMAAYSAMNPASIDAPLQTGKWGDNSENTTIAGLLRYHDADPGEAIDQQAAKYRLACAIESLPKRQRWIVQQYYGLDGGEPRTLQSIATELGFTRERVRQVKGQAEDALLKKPAARAAAFVLQDN